MIMRENKLRCNRRLSIVIKRDAYSLLFMENECFCPILVPYSPFQVWKLENSSSSRWDTILAESTKSPRKLVEEVGQKSNAVDESRHVRLHISFHSKNQKHACTQGFELSSIDLRRSSRCNHMKSILEVNEAKSEWSYGEFVSKTRVGVQ